MSGSWALRWLAGLLAGWLGGLLELLDRPHNTTHVPDIDPEPMLIHPARLVPRPSPHAHRRLLLSLLLRTLRRSTHTHTPPPHPITVRRAFPNTLCRESQKLQVQPNQDEREVCMNIHGQAPRSMLYEVACYCRAPRATVPSKHTVKLPTYLPTYLT